MGTADENKLIAEFMGYKLGRCNRGMAWESPFKKAVEDIFKIHGRLWSDTDTFYKWDTDWNWLMPVVEKIEDQGFNVNIKGISCTVTELFKEEPIISWVLGNKAQKIVLVHTAVISFIKLQNNKTK